MGRRVIVPASQVGYVYHDADAPRRPELASARRSAPCPARCTWSGRAARPQSRPLACSRWHPGALRLCVWYGRREWSRKTNRGPIRMHPPQHAHCSCSPRPKPTVSCIASELERWSLFTNATPISMRSLPPGALVQFAVSFLLMRSSVSWTLWACECAMGRGT